MPDARYWHNGEAQFFTVLSGASKAKFYAAVFFIFSAFGVLWDIGSSTSRAWYMIAAWVVYSGAIAVMFAHAFTHNRKLLFAVIPLSFVIPMVLENLARTWHLVTVDPGGGQWPHMIASIVLVVMGYILFISFINGEGARSFRLQTEVNMAERIHDNLVPPIDERTGTLELRGVSHSSSEVGGDLLDAVIDADRVRLCVADVSGHGVQAGLMMGMMKSAVRMKLLQSDDLKSLVNDLNRVSFQVKTPEMFVTAAFMRFDHSRTAQWALAGHPPILHYIKDEGRTAQIASPSPPLGILESIEYTAFDIAFAPGDLFVILTDGLTEVFDESEEVFGIEPIVDIITTMADQPLAAIEKTILAAVQEFGQQDDDQTLLLVRVL